MIIEVAHLATVFAFVMAVALAFVGHLGAWTRRLSWVEACSTLASAQLIALLLGLVGLVIAFYQDDFSVRYVANNSNELLNVTDSNSNCAVIIAARSGHAPIVPCPTQ